MEAKQRARWKSNTQSEDDIVPVLKLGHQRMNLMSGGIEQSR